MSDPGRMFLPASPDEFGALRAGDEFLLSGPVFTARDATHARLVAELDAHEGALPYGLKGQVLFYAGPTPPAAGRPAGSVGPTTASRMDPWTPRLLNAGIAAMIGKGGRSAEVVSACRESGAVYFAAVGGSAALLATRVSSAEIVAYPELGTEALVRLELREFPVVVAIDVTGADLYSMAPREWRETVAEGSL